MKRILTILLVLALALPLFAAGGASQGPGTTGTAGERVVTQVTPRPLPAAAAPQYDDGDRSWHPQPATSYSTNPRYPQQPAISNRGGYPLVQNTVTMRLARTHNLNVTDYYDNDVVRFLEALTNVRIEWDLLPALNPGERVNLMFASGDVLPDAFYGYGFTSADLITFGEAGLLIPLSEIVADNSYYYQRLLDDDPNIIPALTMADGRIYSMGSQEIQLANQLAWRFWINQLFLDNLGMATPTTTEEYYRYLVAVRDRDPNRNGRNDEIPLIAGIDGWNPNIDGFLMQSFIANDRGGSRSRMYRTETGQIEVSYNKPEWRQGLEYLRRLMQENLMTTEIFTLTRAGMMALVEHPDGPMVGSIPMGGPMDFADTAGERRTHFRILAPLRGPNGRQHAAYSEFAGVGISFFAVTKDSRMPELAVKWADYLYTPDYATRSRYGVLGRDWIIPPPGTVAVDGGQARFEDILRWGDPQNAHLSGGGGRGFFASYHRAVGPDPFELEAVLWNARQVYYPYRWQMNVPGQLPFTVDEAREFNNLNTQLRDHVEQSMAQFISGVLPLNDANWNAYLQTIDRLGVAQLLRITQAAFDRSWAYTLGYR